MIRPARGRLGGFGRESVLGRSGAVPGPPSTPSTRRRRFERATHVVFGGAGADAVVLEPDDADRRALHNIYIAVPIKVDGVHRRRALAMDAGGQQRRRQSYHNASHSIACCYARPSRVVRSGALHLIVAYGQQSFLSILRIAQRRQSNYLRSPRAIEAPPRARACQPPVEPWDDARLL